MRLPSLVFLLLPLVSLGLAAPLHEERPLSLPRETEQIEYPDVQDIMRRVDETDTLSEVEKRQVYDLVLRSPNPTSEVMNIMARAPSCTDMGRKVLSFVGAKKLEYGAIPFSSPPPFYVLLHSSMSSCGRFSLTFTFPRIVAVTSMVGGWVNVICNHYGATECEWWAHTIVIFISTIGTGAWLKDGALGQPAKRGLPDPAWADYMNTTLHSIGASYTELEHVDLSSWNQRRDTSDTPTLTHRSVARGFQSGGSSHDIAFNHFSNGDMSLHLGSPNQTLSSNPHLDNNKRASSVNNKGLKIVYSRKVYSTGITQTEARKMGQDLANDWAQRATTRKMGDYIGAIKNGNKLVVDFRIIPETKGFALNYEEVNVCPAKP